MLTQQDYESYKKRLTDADKAVSVLLDRQAKLAEQLKEEFGLTPEEAPAELERLTKELEEKESVFEEMFKEFNNKWNEVMKKNSVA